MNKLRAVTYLSKTEIQYNIKKIVIMKYKKNKNNLKFVFKKLNLLNKIKMEIKKKSKKIK